MSNMNHPADMMYHGYLVRDPLEYPQRACAAGLGGGQARGTMMDDALQRFGGQIGARPTYADFYKHIDSVFQCIWNAQAVRDGREDTGSVWENLSHAETALQALDDYIYEKLGKGDL